MLSKEPVVHLPINLQLLVSNLGVATATLCIKCQALMGTKPTFFFWIKMSIVQTFSWCNRRGEHKLPINSTNFLFFILGVWGWRWGVGISKPNFKCNKQCTTAQVYFKFTSVPPSFGKVLSPCKLINCPTKQSLNFIDIDIDIDILWIYYLWT